MFSELNVLSSRGVQVKMQERAQKAYKGLLIRVLASKAAASMVHG